VDEIAWLECTDPWPMLEFLQGKASVRKLRLFTLAVGTCTPPWWIHFLRMFNRHSTFEAIAGGTPAWSSGTTAERPTQAALLRDIFGNPFRPVTLDPTWLTPTVKALAQAIYEERTFTDLPVIADALEDAGCANADILDHCRPPGEHVRGCWAVDLVLGKK
jgi:hypothetical protein